MEGRGEMKQPKNNIAISEVWLPIAGKTEYCVDIESNAEWALAAEIGEGDTKQSALKAAIKRLKRLTKDAEKMLEDKP